MRRGFMFRPVFTCSLCVRSRCSSREWVTFQELALFFMCFSKLWVSQQSFYRSALTRSDLLLFHSYSVEGFLDKNKDPLFQDFKRLMYNRYSVTFYEVLFVHNQQVPVYFILLCLKYILVEEVNTAVSVYTGIKDTPPTLYLIDKEDTPASIYTDTEDTLPSISLSYPFVLQSLWPFWIFLSCVISSDPVLKDMWPEGKLSITEVTKRPLTAATLFKNSIIALIDKLACKVRKKSLKYSQL